MWLLGFELRTFGRTVGCSYPLSHLTSPNKFLLIACSATSLASYSVLKWSAEVVATAAAHYTRPAEVVNIAAVIQLQLVAAVPQFVLTDSLLAFVW